MNSALRQLIQHMIVSIPDQSPVVGVEEELCRYLKQLYLKTNRPTGNSRWLKAQQDR